jgi:zinc transporter ZupT
VLFFLHLQELGDYSVLLHAGFSHKKALLMNFLISLTSFVGCISSLVLGSQFSDAVTSAAA